MAGPGRAEVSTAWLIRAGRSGERDDFNLEHGQAGLGWGNLADLTDVSSRREIEAMIRRARPDASNGSVATHTGQVWALRKRVRMGDLVALPLKTTSQIALGTVVRQYWYNKDADPTWRHVVSVDWKRTDVPRTAVKQDLLYSLGSALTICTITRNDGAWRLHQLLLTGHDPGARLEHTIGADDTDSAEGTDVDDSPESSIDVERVGKDLIQSRITEMFSGHELSRLVRTQPPGSRGSQSRWVHYRHGTAGAGRRNRRIRVRTRPARAGQSTPDRASQVQPLSRRREGRPRTQRCAKHPKRRPGPTGRLGRCQQDRPP